MSGGFGDHTFKVIQGELALFNLITREIEIGRLGPNTLNILQGVNTSAVLLSELGSSAHAGNIRKETISVVANEKNESAKLARKLSQVFPVRLKGFWIADRKKFWLEPADIG